MDLKFLLILAGLHCFLNAFLSNSNAMQRPVTFPEIEDMSEEEVIIVQCLHTEIFLP